MKTRKTFCYNCREKTVTVYGQAEIASCWKCGNYKELSVDDSNRKEDFNTLKIITILAASALIIAILIRYIF